VIVAFDVKGTLDAWPKQLGEVMTALKASGDVIYILTGISADAVAEDDETACRAYLASVGITPAMFDQLVIVPKPHPSNKAAVCVEHHIDVLFDNKKSTAELVTEATGGTTLCVVPWATREK
jgi:hypothetical protein